MRKNITLLLGLIFFITSCNTSLPQATDVPPSKTPTITPSPTVTPTPTPTFTPTPVPTQIGGTSGKLLLAYNFSASDKFPELHGGRHIFLTDIESGEQTPISSELNGVNYIQDISPDGTKVLVLSRSNFDDTKGNLYLIDLENLNSPPVKLVENLERIKYARKNTLQAAWLDNSNFIYIGLGDNGFGIYSINIDNLNTSFIYKNIGSKKTGTPFEILAISNERIYWDAQIVTRLTSNSVNIKYFVSWVSIDGQETGTLEFQGEQLYKRELFDDLAISPDGKNLAWVEYATSLQQSNYLHVAPISDLENSNLIDIGFPRFRMTWFPDSSKVVIFNIESVFWSKQRTVEAYQYLDKEMPSNFFDKYGIFEIPMQPNTPVVNYGISENIFYAGNYDAEKGSEARYNVYRNLFGVSPDGKLALFAIHKIDTTGVGNYECLKLVNTQDFSIQDLDYFYLEDCYSINLNARWIP